MSGRGPPHRSVPAPFTLEGVSVELERCCACDSDELADEAEVETEEDGKPVTWLIALCDDCNAKLSIEDKRRLCRGDD